MDKEKKKKQNSVLKNICIVYAAMFKRYRSAPVFVTLYISVSVAMPFLTTLTPSLAIAGISSGNIKTFLLYSSAAITSFCILSALKGFLKCSSSFSCSGKPCSFVICKVSFNSITTMTFLFWIFGKLNSCNFS